MALSIRPLLLYTITLSILFSSFGSNVFSSGETVTKSIDDLAFKQELAVPIGTGLEEAKFQPVDMRVEFGHPCWAEDETAHSIRIGYDAGSGLTELESQIYDLEHGDNSHITACSLVFLIPEDADGKETYYVLYDGSETDSPEYDDHLSIEDTHYFYEPISGQKIDFDYYKIIQGEYIVYGVCQKGILLGNGMSNSVIKLKPESTEFETVNSDQIAAFYMSYNIDGEKESAGTSMATDISKSILVDGNLMVRLRIGGVSPEGIIKTDNIYTYYYCPTLAKRLNVNVYHEVLETTEIKGAQQRDPTYASLATFKARSATIDKMNIGNILPSLHFYGEDNSIKEYLIPTDPNTEKEEWVLSTASDADIGSRAWLCMDDPSTGKAHGLVFESITGFLEGEEDGLQVKASTKQHVKLPGLEADSGDVFATRNSYESGKHDTSLPKGMNVAFNAEFITFETEGYEAVDKESEIYPAAVGGRPIYRGNVSKEQEKDRYTLVTYVHLAPSLPLGSTLSAVLGKNISYIYAELYKAGSLSSSGSIGRLPLSEGMELDFEDTSLVEKVKIALGLFDWRNASLFKKICFPGLEEGKYLIKVYKENPLFGKERQYIGFKIIEMEENASVHVCCRPEGKLQTSIADQNENGVENVKFSLTEGDVTIAESLSDKNGSARLKAPYSLPHSYVLKVIYHGFLVEEKEIRLSLARRLLPLKKTFGISLYQLELNVKDTWGMPPAVDISPMLTSDEMVKPTPISAEKQGNGKYMFINLYPADYDLRMSYKSFVIEEDISLSGDKVLGLTFPAEFAIDIDVMNSHGMQLKEGKIFLERGGENIATEIGRNGKATVFVPPGEYEMHIFTDGRETAMQKIDIRGDKSLDVVTSQKSSLHIMVTYLGIAIAVFSVLFVLWKKDIHVGVKLLAFALIITAIVSPWWTLRGDDGMISTNTKTLLVPSKIVTLTTSQSVIGGEVSLVPPEFTMALDVLVVLLMAACVSIALSMSIKNRTEKISSVLSVVSIVLVLITVLLFFYTMSQVTNIGVGSFSGNGNLDISVPGIQEKAGISCSWGPGLGFYLSLIAAVCMTAAFFLKRKNRLLGIFRKWKQFFIKSE